MALENEKPEHVQASDDVRLNAESPVTVAGEQGSDLELEVESFRAAPSFPSQVEGESVWYTSDRTGKQEGPLPLAALRQRMATGSLSADDLVWRTGLPSWVPARTIPELFNLGSGQDSTIPPPLPAGRRNLPSSFRELDQFLSRPVFFRTLARICAALSILALLGSVLLAYWQKTWFEGAVLLALMFLVGEAFGAVLAALQRIDSHLSKPEGSTQGRSNVDAQQQR
jgi:hypothetical protein